MPESLATILVPQRPDTTTEPSAAGQPPVEQLVNRAGRDLLDEIVGTTMPLNRRTGPPQARQNILAPDEPAPERQARLQARLNSLAAATIFATLVAETPQNPGTPDLLRAPRPQQKPSPAVDIPADVANTIGYLNDRMRRALQPPSAPDWAALRGPASREPVRYDSRIQDDAAYLARQTLTASLGMLANESVMDMPASVFESVIATDPRLAHNRPGQTAAPATSEAFRALAESAQRQLAVLDKLDADEQRKVADEAQKRMLAALPLFVQVETREPHPTWGLLPPEPWRDAAPAPNRARLAAQPETEWAPQGRRQTAKKLGMIARIMSWRLPEKLTSFSLPIVQSKGRHAAKRGFRRSATQIRPQTA